MCITGEKSLQTIWDELMLEFERITLFESQYGMQREIGRWIDVSVSVSDSRDSACDSGTPPLPPLLVRLTKL
jgi:hypothetical protein